MKRSTNGGADVACGPNDDANTGAVQLTLLGTLGVTVDDRTVVMPPNAQRLLAYLAIERRWITRSATAGALWPNADPRRASGNLRSALWRITTSIGQVVVAAQAHSLRLDDYVDVDLHRVEEAARSCRAPGASPGGEPDSLGLDLLPDWDDDWITVRRECFRQVRLRALEAWCAQRRLTGHLDQALHLALAAVSAEPLRESAHCQLVEVHLAEGNAAEAVRQYHLYRQLLGAQLGLKPSPVIRRLVAPLLAGSAH